MLLDEGIISKSSHVSLVLKVNLISFIYLVNSVGWVAEIVAQLYFSGHLSAFDSNNIPCELIYTNIDQNQYSIIEEAETDDIPFDTYQLIKEFKTLDSMDNVMFSFEDEKDVNDIPFDTDKIITIFH